MHCCYAFESSIQSLGADVEKTLLLSATALISVDDWGFQVKPYWIISIGINFPYSLKKQLYHNQSSMYWNIH